jgi:hypothetical protein
MGPPMTHHSNTEPQCVMCRRVTQSFQDGLPFCDDCGRSFELNVCEQCRIPAFRSRTVTNEWYCTICRARAWVAAAPEAEIAQIREYVRDGEKMIALQEIRRVMQLPLKDARVVLAVLADGG